MRYYLLLGIYLNKELNVYENILYGKINKRLEGFAYSVPSKNGSKEYNFIEKYSILNRDYISKKKHNVPRKICTKYLMDMELTNLYVAEFDISMEGAVIKKLNPVKL